VQHSYTAMNSEQIGKLILLSIIWGGSFLFSGIAVLYIHPLWVVTIRVSLATMVMLVVLRMLGLSLPNNIREWARYLGMGLLNNVIPFSAIFYAQTYISVSLASIVNTMTPVFTFLVLAGLSIERLTVNRIVGALIGITGTVMLFDEKISFADANSMGLVLSLTGALSYALGGVWTKHLLTGQPPVKVATSQLISSSLVMIVLVSIMQIPLPQNFPPVPVVTALLGLAVVSTAFAYVLFFDVMVKSGPANATLVTMLVPVSGSFLGWLVMDDILTGWQIFGGLVIILALLVIDGRLFRAMTR
jgi:drug/metabolite transporter (DMT)-like permease